MSNSARVCLCMAVLFPAMFLFAVSPALAQVTFSDNEAQFLARNPNLQFQDFESGNVATDAIAECSPVLNENTSDTCFSPGDILPGLQFAEVPVNELNIAGPDVEDNPFVVLFPGFFTDSLDITFPGNSVNAAGLILGCLSEGGPCSDTLIIRVFGTGDSLIGTATAAVTGQFNTFLGIQSSELITRINVGSLAGNGFEGLGSISFGLASRANIPTLSEWGMVVMAALMLAAGAVVVSRRRGSEHWAQAR